MPALTDYSVDSLADLLAAAGHRPEHARTVLGAYHAGFGRADLAAVPSIPKSLAAFLRDRVAGRRSRVLVRNASRDGTVKLLIGLQGEDGDRDADRGKDGRGGGTGRRDGGGGGAVEAVLMPTHVRAERAAGCVS